MKSFLLVLALTMLLLISACGGDKESTSLATTTQPPTPSVTLTPSSTLSEQPDMATYNKYFSELGIGRMLNDGKNPPLDLQKNVSVFNHGDQFCIYGNAILECQIIFMIVNVDNVKTIRYEPFPKTVINGFASWEPMAYPAGHYEYKIYVDSKLAGIFPFEVK
jgi:hypothetical protein